MTPASAISTPWVDVELDGRAYKIQPLGAEQAFELDAHLLHLLGEGMAAVLGSGLEGVLPALIMSVAEKFSEAQSMAQLRAELDRILDLDMGDPEVREFLGRLLVSLAPKCADVVRETVPTVASRITPSQARELVRICLFRHLQYRSAAGHWLTVESWADLDNALVFVHGHRRQTHKWALLIRAIQVTWGPSGAADPTAPEVERHADPGE